MSWVLKPGEDEPSGWEPTRLMEVAAVKGGEKVALRAALLRYGDHTSDCPRRSRSAAGQCTCGWSEVAPEIGVES